MAIEKINLVYPKGTLQSVFDAEAVTALELAALTSKKVDECVDLVNGVELIATEATAVVDEMKTAQEQFIIENNDIRSQMLEEITTTVENFSTSATNELNTYKSGLNVSKQNFETSMNNELATFKTNLNEDKAAFVSSANQVIQNSSAQIQQNVNDKITGLISDGTLSNLINDELLGDIHNDVNSKLVVISSLEPTLSEVWFDIKGTAPVDIPDDVIFQEI
jgi:polyhydroxyalkanoate synthesis regulator phasin